eukprot:TRINITY_DN4872_c1_g1_i1.p1 TRINITY_DN4872_c1_g1~~TRINITY_DN4872_c1_g1_i1.p1  ORF type:complete len:112 (-),score=19.16 TRINITY_DN4872_c1_g1_i1:879-1214(-)
MKLDGGKKSELSYRFTVKLSVKNKKTELWLVPFRTQKKKCEQEMGRMLFIGFDKRQFFRLRHGHIDDAVKISNLRREGTQRRLDKNQVLWIGIWNTASPRAVPTPERKKRI